MDQSLLEEFRLDWRLAGKAERTASDFSKAILQLLEARPDPTLVDVKEWLSATSSPAVRRKRGQAIRAFGKWAAGSGYDAFPWWRLVPLAREVQKPQRTAVEADYRAALKRAVSLRDKALVEVLWACGLRRSEIVRLGVEDVNLRECFLVIRRSKSGRPRIVPLSPCARQALRRLIESRSHGLVFEMTSNAVRLCLSRLGAPSAHAWRRGWAVESLRRGVSETSVKAAAGWTDGAMVARYTNAMASQLALEEFKVKWATKRR